MNIFFFTKFEINIQKISRKNQNSGQTAKDTTKMYINDLIDN